MKGYGSCHQPADTEGFDHRLVASIRLGSEDAAEELVRTYWLDAYRVAYLLTHDRGAAEDIAQESVLAAINAMASFDETRPLRPWLERIAVNRSRDWLRRRRSRPELIVEEPAPDQAGGPPVDDLVAQALPEDLVSALGELDPDHRTAVVLRHLLDYKPPEIAAIVGASEGAVRSRIHRGLRRLRETLEPRKEAIDDRTG